MRDKISILAKNNQTENPKIFMQTYLNISDTISNKIFDFYDYENIPHNSLERKQLNYARIT